MGTGLTRVRASTRRDGADRSGLAALLDLSVINAAGDALVTVVLAGSLFFSVPTGEARSKVALYLLITMVPFVLLAPVIGPVLDRFPYGRRSALAALCLGRGMLAWQLAASLTGLAVYPLALGLLMLSRAFGVARSAVIPRVAPPELTLVKVNSRMSMVNIVAGTIAAPVGLGVAHIPYVGYPWVLRICAVLYLAGVPYAFKLPKRVDSNEGERRLRDVVASATGPRAPLVAGEKKQRNQSRPARARAAVRAVLGGSPAALRSTLVLRTIVGFLTFYLAFLLRAEGGTSLWLGVLAAAAAVGSGLGVLIGGRLGRRRPERLLTLALLLTTGSCALAAVTYAKLTALLAALLAMLAASMAKLALDAIIQRDTADDVRNSAFARSETVLQLGWVGGGAVGLIEMPGPLGFVLAAAAAGATVFGQARELRRIRAARRAEADAPETAGDWPTGEPWSGGETWSAGREVLPAMMPPPGDQSPPAGWPAAATVPRDQPKPTRRWGSRTRPQAAPRPPSTSDWPQSSWSGDPSQTDGPGWGEGDDWPPAAAAAGGPVPAVDAEVTLPARRRRWGPRASARPIEPDPDTTRPLDQERRHPQVPPPRADLPTD
ncbi:MULTISPECIES: MFS transporter [Pseudofrankia]|uniref:MFS transporter n=1 Tax=Pseudofrankia TaxID=2994363 RepID=UPI000234BAAE|nr:MULTISPECIES: MFS transporter [Pseudofrankia]